jgi:hypothetical protein
MSGSHGKKKFIDSTRHKHANKLEEFMAAAFIVFFEEFYEKLFFCMRHLKSRLRTLSVMVGGVWGDICSGFSQINSKWDFLIEKRIKL